MLTRPDPEQLLKRVQDEEARSQRARLKVFFGAAPGVGKTYAMLQEAHLKKAEGIDVVVGVVETHRRAETMALLEGLEVLPRRARSSLVPRLLRWLNGRLALCVNRSPAFRFGIGGAEQERLVRSQ